MSWLRKDYTAIDLKDLAYEWIPDKPNEYDRLTYEALLQWREAFSTEHNLAPVDVVTDEHLMMVAAARPTDDEQFKEIGLDKVRIQVIGGVLSAHVAAQQMDWHGVARAPEQEDGAYSVPGEDEVKTLPDSFLTETDSLDEKL